MENDKINDKINDLVEQILKLIAENKYITISELSIETQKSEPTHRHLDRLTKLSFIRRGGSREFGYWEKIK